jgi:hypothetical protein
MTGGECDDIDAALADVRNSRDGCPGRSEETPRPGAAHAAVSR